MIRVLLLSADPKENHPLNLDQEFRRIRKVHESSKYRDEFQIESCLATTYEDLSQKLLEYKPSLIHFCGHGVGREGIVFVDENGKKETIETEVLANLFRICQDDNTNIACVVFNACHAAFQAKEISKYVKYCIGMSQEIKDAHAIHFAPAFYQAIFAKVKIKTAFELGCNEIRRFSNSNSNTVRAEYDPASDDIIASQPTLDYQIPQFIVNAYLHDIYDLNQGLLQPKRIISYEQWDKLHQILSEIDLTILKNVYRYTLETLKEPIVLHDILSRIKNLVDLEELLLENYSYKNNDSFILLDFAKYLTAIEELNENQNDKIKQWIKEIAKEKNIDLQILLEKPEPTLSILNKTLNSYLLISIIENSIDNFSLKAELIRDYQKWKQDHKSIPITSEEGGINGISIEQVGFFMSCLIDRAIEELDPPYNLTIELFVPSDYLGKPFELLEISVNKAKRKRAKEKNQSTALVGKYQFTIRCLERYENKSLYNEHLKVWNAIQSFFEKEKSEIIVKNRCESLRLLNQKLNFKKLCTKWNENYFYAINIIDGSLLNEEEDSGNDYFYNFVDSGVPISLWSRSYPDKLYDIDGKNHTVETVEGKFKEILHIKSFEDLSQIFQRIHKLRKDAYDEEGDEAKKYLGYHLGFICDRPDLIPYNLAVSLKGNNRLQGSN